MTMSNKLILIMYAVTGFCACDFTKLTISHIFMYMYFYDKNICNESSYVYKIYVCLPACLSAQHQHDQLWQCVCSWFIIAIFCSGYTNYSIFNKNKKKAAVVDSCVKYWLNYLKGTIETLSAQNYLATINQLLIIINTLFLASIREKRYWRFLS